MKLYRNHFAKVSFFVGFLLPFPVCALGGHLVGEVIVIAGAGTGTGIGTGTVTGTERVLRARIALATHTHTQWGNVPQAACRMPHAVCDVAVPLAGALGTDRTRCSTSMNIK